MTKYPNWLSKLSRPKKVAFQLIADLILIVLAFVSAMLFRLEDSTFIGNSPVWFSLFSAAAVGLLSLYFLGLYRVLVRFVTGKVLIVIAKAMLITVIALYINNIIFESRIPRSVPIIFGIFGFLAIGSLRFAARTFFRTPSQIIKRPVIIYGAGIRVFSF